MAGRAQRSPPITATSTPSRPGSSTSSRAARRRASSASSTSSLIERAGNAAGGSITAFYTVLLEGELRAGMTRRGIDEAAQDAIRAGAYDFIVKPPDLPSLGLALERCR